VFDLRTTTLVGSNIVLDAGWGNDTVFGSAGNDTIANNQGDDLMDGAGGSDTFRVSGNTTLDFQGYDTYKDSGTAGTDKIVVTGGTLAVDIGIKGWSATGIEQVDASGTTGVVRLLDTNDAHLLDFRTTTLTGSNLVIDAGYGNDTIYGSAAADTIVGGSGNDVVDGGAGGDTYRVTGNEAGGWSSFQNFDTYADTGTTGTDKIVALGTGDVDIGLLGNFGAGSGIEAIDATGATGTVRLLGDSGAQTLDFRSVTLTGTRLVIDAGNGNDVVYGSAGDDTLASNNGEDTVDGAGGGDTFRVTGNATTGFQGYDTYKDSGTAGTDRIVVTGGTLAVDIGIKGWSGTGIEQIDATGTTGAVRLLDTGDANLIDLRTTTLTGSNLVIDAGYGSDTVYGSAAADTILAGSGNDVVDGGAGGDTYRVTGNEAGGWSSFQNFDTYADTGTTGTDRIVALGTGDVDIGLLGNFGAGSGIEAVDGTGATGTVRLYGDGSATTLDFRAVTVTGANVVIDSNYGNDTVYGSAGADTILSSWGDDVFDGAGGGDTFRVTGNATTGFQGYDTYVDSGTSGTDKIVAVGTGDVDIGFKGNFGPASGIEAIDATGATGTVRLLGDSGAQTLDFRSVTLTGTRLVIDAGNGNDVVYGSAADDTLVSNNGDDTVDGAGGSDTYRVTGNAVLGFLGRDTFKDSGTTGTDKVVAVGAGNVDIGINGWQGTGIEVIDGSGAAGTVRVWASDSANVLDFSAVTFVGGNVLIDGAYGNDTILGSAGADVIQGGADADRLDGQNGGDTYRVSGNRAAGWSSFQGFDTYADTGTVGTDRIVVLGTGDVDIGVAGWTNTGIEVVDATGATGTVRLLGQDSADVLDFRGTTLTGSNLVIDGAYGNDTLFGSAGADTIVGAGNDDRIDGAEDGDTFRVTGNFAGGWSSFQGYDTYSDTGTTGTDRLVALGGAVDIGLAGWQNTGVETIDATGATGTVRLLGGDGATVFDFRTTTLTGSNLVIDGAWGSDTLIGSAAADQIVGGGGDDSLDGFEGGDTYQVSGSLAQGWSVFQGFDTYQDSGTTGIDTLHAQGAGDVDIGLLSFDASSGIEVIDTRDVAGQTRIVGSWSDDVLDFSGTSILGSRVVLDGSGGTDVIIGSAGNDTIIGGSGADSMAGGAGNDVYRVGRGSGMDVIWDADETAGNQDVVEFGAGIAIDQLWFQRLDGFLEVSVIGSWDRVYVMDWDTDPASQIEQFRTADGHVLLNTQVDTLISAMAAFDAPSGGTTTLPEAYRAVLAPVIASTWS